MRKLIDLTGQRFGRLVIISSAFKDKHNQWHWNCKCDCGNHCVVRGYNLREGTTQSCGCIRIENPPNLVHGFDGTKLGYVRSGMQQRCYNPKSLSYKNYGARGITICDEWLHNSKTFYEWAVLSGYEENKKLSLDRIDNNGPYSPENCRWATIEEQANNKRTNHLYFSGGEGRNIKEWSLHLNISTNTLFKRLKMGWSEEKTFSTPIDKKYSTKRKRKK